MEYNDIIGEGKLNRYFRAQRLLGSNEEKLSFSNGVIISDTEDGLVMHITSSLDELVIPEDISNINILSFTIVDKLRVASDKVRLINIGGKEMGNFERYGTVVTLYAKNSIIKVNDNVYIKNAEIYKEDKNKAVVYLTYELSRYIAQRNVLIHDYKIKISMDTAKILCLSNVLKFDKSVLPDFRAIIQVSVEFPVNSGLLINPDMTLSVTWDKKKHIFGTLSFDKNRVEYMYIMRKLVERRNVYGFNTYKTYIKYVEHGEN